MKYAVTNTSLRDCLTVDGVKIQSQQIAFFDNISQSTLASLYKNANAHVQIIDKQRSTNKNSTTIHKQPVQKTVKPIDTVPESNESVPVIDIDVVDENVD